MSVFKKIFFISTCALSFMVAIPTIIALVNSPALRSYLFEVYIARRNSDHKVVFFGDSHVIGGGIWNLKLKNYDTNIWTYGYAGFNSEQLSVCVTNVNLKNTKYMIIMMGSNDVSATNVSPESFEENYKIVLRYAFAENVTPVVCEIPYTENGDDLKRIMSFNTKLRAICNEMSLPMIKLNHIVAPRGELLERFSDDGLHFNAKGYEIWADEINNTLILCDQPVKVTASIF